MAPPGKSRPVLLGLALAATLAASVWVSRQESGEEEAVQPRPRLSVPASTGAKAEASPEDREQLPAAARAPRPAGKEEVIDLFPRQTWYVPPPPPPPTAPPLPFTYLGKVVDGNEMVVFVSLAERNFAVHKGEVINGNYRIDDIAPPTMTVTYLPLNQKQTLDIGRVN